MTNLPGPANRAGRQQHSRKAQAQALNAVAAAATAQQQAAPVDPRLWWEQLLQEEAELQKLEAIATCQNVRCSHGLWTDLHDRSERLAHQMAACIALLEGR